MGRFTFQKSTGKKSFIQQERTFRKKSTAEKFRKKNPFGLSERDGVKIVEIRKGAKFNRKELRFIKKQK